MSNDDIKTVLSLKLSEPVPTKALAMVKKYMEGKPACIRKGLQSWIDNSQ